MTNPYTEPFGDKPPLVERWNMIAGSFDHTTNPLMLRGIAAEWLAGRSRSPLQIGSYASGWAIRYFGESVEFRGPTLDDALNAACHAALDARGVHDGD